ncbi:hypothetical protein K439DRAFT_1553993 [Ramaria rubella]|nr:hypothetical protein K439DRAFT_1553993 [Ramaria rubella]
MLVEMASLNILYISHALEIMPPLHIDSTTLQTFHISFLTMSSQEELATIIQEQADNMAFKYVLVASFTLLAYDPLLIFPSEVKFIWYKKFKLGTILYLLARYPALLEFLLDVYLDFATFPSVQSYNALGLLPLIGVQGLLFARAYAISSHNKLVFMMLALLGTIATVLFMQTLIAYPLLIFLLYVRHSALFSKTEFMIHVSVETLNGVFTILFDTVVFVAIIENTLGLLQHQRGVPGLQRKSLSNLLVQQANAVTLKVLRPTLQGILGTLQNSLSIIIICHFHLDLQQRNDHPNGSNTSHSLPLGSSHAVKERIHRAIVDEFGDLSFNESFDTEGSQEDIQVELQAIQSPNGVAEIDLQEFPWAGGDIGNEEAGPVASGSGILRE